MFTIILGEKGNRIIWASLEHEENGIYKEFVPIKDRIDEEWAREALKLIVENRLDDLFEYLKKWISKEPKLKHMELGLIKIAGIQFFDEFRKAYEISDKGADMGTLLAYMIEAFKNVFEKNWIRFAPEPYGINIVRKLFLEKLDLNPEFIKSAILPMLPDLNMGVALLSEEWGTMVNIQKKGDKLTIVTDQDKADAAFKKGIEIKKYTDKVRKKFKAKIAMGFDATALIKLLLKILKAESPWNFEKIDKGVSLLIPGVKDYKKYWYYSPELIFMKGWVQWFARRIGYDFNLDRFSDWWVDELLIFVLLNMVGLQFKIATFILDDAGNLETALLIEGDEGRLQKIITLPEPIIGKLKDIFLHEENKTEAVAKAKFELWENYGWIKYALGIKTSIIREAMERTLKLSGFILALPFRVLFFYSFLKRMLKNELYMVPIIPFDKVLKEIGLRDLLKIGKAAMGVLFDDPEVEYPNLEKAGLC